MDVVKLLAVNHIETGTEAAYRFITQSTMIPHAHTHDFFEVFLVVRGRVFHYINGIKQILTAGSFVFVRDSDVHYYEKYNEEEYHFINLVFLSSTFEALINYIGAGFPFNTLLKPEFLPIVQLSESEAKEVRLSLESLAAISRMERLKMQSRLRIILVEFFTQFFSPEQHFRGYATSWLERLKEEMRKIENFTEGITAMQRLSHKNQDYLSRAWKKFDNRTPTEFIIELRMEYVANLLMHSDESILNIAMTAGFYNISHFYKVFRLRFGTTPLSYRRAYSAKQSLL